VTEMSASLRRALARGSGPDIAAPPQLVGAALVREQKLVGRAYPLGRSDG
jgi:hypothetical protein